MIFIIFYSGFDVKQIKQMIKETQIRNFLKTNCNNSMLENIFAVFYFFYKKCKIAKKNPFTIYFLELLLTEKIAAIIWIFTIFKETKLLVQ